MQKRNLRSSAAGSVLVGTFAVVAATAQSAIPVMAQHPTVETSSPAERLTHCGVAGPMLLAGLERDSSLPDSPGAAFSSSAEASFAEPQKAARAPVLPPNVPPIAPKSQFTIKPGQTAQPLSAGNKLSLGVRDALGPAGFAASIAAAGLAHGLDSRPHFGTDSAGFGERVGASVYRGDVKAFFGTGIFPMLFHDDPRYYVLGDTAPFKQRVLYAATRVVIARKDNGDRGINYPRLLAPVVSQGSANGFYPQRDQDVTKTVTGILVSYATSAGTDELKEFTGDVLRRLHRKH